MKKYLFKKWHSIPVGIILAVVLMLTMVGGVFAAYNFFTVTATVEVREAVAASYGWGDDLSPYMLPIGAVPPSVIGVPDKWRVDESGNSAIFTIAKNDDVDASELVAGEVLVIPVAFRNRGDVSMPIGATVSGGGLELAWAWETNTTGADYRATDTSVWTDFSDENFTTVLAPHGGNFGSAQIGAQVLFIKITVPLDASPDNYTITVTFSRG